LAPFCAAEVELRINYHLAALATLQFWFVFEKLDGGVTAGAFYLKNIFGLPKSLVLSGASDHKLSFFISSKSYLLMRESSLAAF
jgi:hypothetical protein